jgi:hypothetical protein
MLFVADDSDPAAERRSRDVIRRTTLLKKRAPNRISAALTLQG